MDDFDDLDDLVGLPPTVALPNLDHWKSVMEFSVEQAALLLAMIDPFDCNELSRAKEKKLSRWKEAHGHSLGIISAIRQGLISPVVCKGWLREEYTDSYGNPGFDQFLRVTRPTDRETDICVSNTIITRASLLALSLIHISEPTRPY